MGKVSLNFPLLVQVVGAHLLDRNIKSNEGYWKSIENGKKSKLQQFSLDPSHERGLTCVIYTSLLRILTENGKIPQMLSLVTKCTFPDYDSYTKILEELVNFSRVDIWVYKPNNFTPDSFKCSESFRSEPVKLFWKENGDFELYRAKVSKDHRVRGKGSKSKACSTTTVLPQSENVKSPVQSDDLNLEGDYFLAELTEEEKLTSEQLDLFGDLTDIDVGGENSGVEISVDGPVTQLKEEVLEASDILPQTSVSITQTAIFIEKTLANVSTFVHKLVDMACKLRGTTSPSVECTTTCPVHCVMYFANNLKASKGRTPKRLLGGSKSSPPAKKVRFSDEKKSSPKKSKKRGEE